MELNNYLLFIAASIFLCVVPGPDMVHLLSRTIAQGAKSGLMAALGMNLGAYCHLLAAILGLSAILATSATAFTIVKWLGTFYLIYLGIQALITKSTTVPITAAISNNAIAMPAFWQGFLSDILNPKVAIFFLAFLPQFVTPASHNHTQQLFLLGITVNVIAIIINILIVHFSSKITNQLRQNNPINSWLNKIMGVTFISLGVKLAHEKI